MCSTMSQSRSWYDDDEVLELFDRMCTEPMSHQPVSDEHVDELWDIKDKKDGETSGDFDTFFATAVISNLLKDGFDVSDESAKKLLGRFDLPCEVFDDAECNLLEVLASKVEDGEISLPNFFTSTFPDFFEEDEDMGDEDEEEEY